MAPDAAVVVVDGMFLHRDRLRNARGRKVWDLSVWLQVPPEVSVRRLAERDGSPSEVDDPRIARYVEGQRPLHRAVPPGRTRRPGHRQHLIAAGRRPVALSRLVGRS